MREPGNVAQKQAFTVRLDADLYLKIIAKAAQEKRTIRAQIECDLESVYNGPQMVSTQRLKEIRDANDKRDKAVRDYFCSVV